MDQFSNQDGTKNFGLLENVPTASKNPYNVWFGSSSQFKANIAWTKSVTLTTAKGINCFTVRLLE
jgi:hypothetical protein